MMKPDLGDTLNECIEAMINDEKLADEYLLPLKEKHAKLEPMLVTATELIGVGEVAPNAERKQQAKERLMALVERKRWESGISCIPAEENTTAKVPQWRKFFTRLGIVTLIFIVLSSGTLVIAEESLPGSPLYPLKLAVEKVRIGLADDDSRAMLYLEAAEERINELKQLKNGDANYIKLVKAFAKNLEAAGLAAGHDDAALKSALADFVRKNEEVLSDILKRAPESAKQAIERALNNGNKGKSGLNERGRAGEGGEKDSDHHWKFNHETEGRDGGRTSPGTEQPEVGKTKGSRGIAPGSDVRIREGKRGSPINQTPAATPSTPGGVNLNPSDGKSPASD
ncbi:MAG: hypothetical protein IBX64_05305 [Actinobacteria bacterium]|nr:hypothetical protein [Actinomycetota bacterium]